MFYGNKKNIKTASLNWFAMLSYVTVLPLLVSFFTVLLVIPYWIKRAYEHNLVGRDMHKHGAEIPELGGLIVIFGGLLGIFTYLGIKIFIFKWNDGTAFVFASISSVLIAMIIGMVDDILGWKIGLRQYQKVLLSFLIPMPLVAVKVGVSVINLPYFGAIDAGYLYPFVMIPFGVVAASNAFNMIAGYNGLESGLGIIILSTLGFILMKTGNSWVALLAFCMVAALLAFFIYNKYPASIFPGDTLTFSVGAFIAMVAIMGNAEKFAVILMIPYLFEFILKARSLMQKESFAKLNDDGSLDVPHKKFYGLEHIAIALIKRIKGKAYEEDVVFVLLGFQLIFVVIALYVFFRQF